MTHLIRRLFDWLERASRERELERYLSQSLNAADLEQRMRAFMWRGRARF